MYLVHLPAKCRETTNVTWMIVAIVFLVVAILLAITSKALGTMLCLTRKSVKSVPAPKLAPREGKCATMINDFTQVYTFQYIHTYIHTHISVHCINA